LVSQHRKENVSVSKGSGVSRGDKRRNARLAELRRLVPRENAIIGIDLAEDNQAVVVTDHDSKVLARRSPRCKAWQLGEVLDWAVARARARGFASVTVACEPTGSRWMHLQQACAERGLSFVCVHTLVTHHAREAEDFTRDKSDHKDAVLIARLAAELRCYRPEVIEEDWAVLRYLGQRRDALVTEVTRCRQQITDRLALAWPAVLGAAAAPLDSTTFLACLQVTVDRCDGDPGRLRRYGLTEFTGLVRGVLGGWGGQRICHRIAAGFHAALGDSRGAVPARRRGALKLAGHALADLRRARVLLAAAEAEMIAQLHVLGIADVLASIDGLSLGVAACILAETGDPARFGSSRALVKHAGAAPCENSSGNSAGQAKISRRGRPVLRKAAWRAAWGMIRGANPVLAAKYAHLTSRSTGQLAKGQAHVACAATLLRWIYSVTTSRTAWDRRVAAGTISHTAAMAA
jgi:transposase